MKKLRIALLLILAVALCRPAVQANTYYLSQTSYDFDYSYEDYVDDLYEEYYINVGQPVRISFSIEYHTEEDCDMVSIYDIDHYGHETLLESASGDGLITINTVTYSGRAKIVFETDGSVSYDNGQTDYMGFYGYYSVVNQNITQYDYIDKNLSVIGKLGVGIETPQEKLHVNGPVRGHGTGGALQVKTDYGYVTVGPQTASYGHLFTDRPAFLMNKPLALQTGVLSSLDNSGLSLQTAGQTRLTVDGSGRVGIGTTSPRYDLDVKGLIRATEVIIHHIDSFPDYVFRPGYELRTVDETDSYIREHGHLPGLPSAAEAEQGGVSLSRLQLQLLEKVEELTLYVTPSSACSSGSRRSSSASSARLSAWEAFLKRFSQPRVSPTRRKTDNPTVG